MEISRGFAVFFCRMPQTSIRTHMVAPSAAAIGKLATGCRGLQLKGTVTLFNWNCQIHKPQSAGDWWPTVWRVGVWVAGDLSR
jgi:hypothetical protein